jgi:type VI secretion system protein ImpF
MALKGKDSGLGLVPSVLDRLIDLEPRSSAEQSAIRYSSVEELKHAVRRDLEWLLNTRRMVTGLTEIVGELQKSIVNYGVPDITGIHIENLEERGDLKSAVESAIRTFEPRFLDVVVHLEPISSTDRQIRFKIEARLDLDPVPEAMVFDTILQLGSGSFAVTESAG